MSLSLEPGKAFTPHLAAAPASMVKSQPLHLHRMESVVGIYFTSPTSLCKKTHLEGNSSIRLSLKDVLLIQCTVVVFTQIVTCHITQYFC